MNFEIILLAAERWKVFTEFDKKEGRRVTAIFQIYWSDHNSNPEIIPLAAERWKVFPECDKKEGRPVKAVSQIDIYIYQPITLIFEIIPHAAERQKQVTCCIPEHRFLHRL